MIVHPSNDWNYGSYDSPRIYKVIYLKKDVNEPKPQNTPIDPNRWKTTYADSYNYYIPKQISRKSNKLPKDASYTPPPTPPLSPEEDKSECTNKTNESDLSQSSVSSFESSSQSSQSPKSNQNKSPKFVYSKNDLKGIIDKTNPNYIRRIKNDPSTLFYSPVKKVKKHPRSPKTHPLIQKPFCPYGSGNDKPVVDKHLYKTFNVMCDNKEVYPTAQTVAISKQNQRRKLRGGNGLPAPQMKPVLPNASEQAEYDKYINSDEYHTLRRIDLQQQQPTLWNDKIVHMYSPDTLLDEQPIVNQLKNEKKAYGVRGQFNKHSLLTKNDKYDPPMYQLLANQYANTKFEYDDKSKENDEDVHVKISPEPPVIINNEPKSVLVKNTESKHSHHHHHHKRHISFDDADVHDNNTLQNQVFGYSKDENQKEENNNYKDNNESNKVIRPIKVPGLSPNLEYTLYVPTDYSQFDPHNFPRFINYSYIDEIPAAGISTIPSESVKNLLHQYN